METEFHLPYARATVPKGMHGGHRETFGRLQKIEYVLHYVPIVPNHGCVLSSVLRTTFRCHGVHRGLYDLRAPGLILKKHGHRSPTIPTSAHIGYHFFSLPFIHPKNTKKPAMGLTESTCELSAEEISEEESRQWYREEVEEKNGLFTFF